MRNRRERSAPREARDERPTVKAANEKKGRSEEEEYIWQPGVVQNKHSVASLPSLSTPNYFQMLLDAPPSRPENPPSVCPKRKTTRPVVHFDERGVRHPTRENARPSYEWALPPSVRAQTAPNYHTREDKRNSERELLSDSAALEEFSKVKHMCRGQKKVVVARRKISCKPRPPTSRSPLPFPVKAGPSSIADTGCSASGIIVAKDSASLTLPNLESSTTRIRDANGRLSNATQETLIRKNEVTGGVGTAILGPAEHLLKGVGQYADKGLVIVYHYAYNVVSVH